MNVRDAWGMPLGEKIMVPFNELGQPICEEGNLLNKFLSDCGRQWTNFPLVESWKSISRSAKDNVFEGQVEVKF